VPRRPDDADPEIQRKSQLAIEYAYRTRAQSAKTWVFWVYASNATRFKQSFQDIADRVKIAGRQEETANIFKLVKDWFYACNETWLLILDNVDDARFLLEMQNGAARPLYDYLPQSENGSILITSRNREAVLKLVTLRDIIIVNPMNSDQALELFEKHSTEKAAKFDIIALADQLDNIPLAMVQAAAYILRRQPRYSVVRYLEHLKDERKRKTLLTHDSEDCQRDREASNSVFATWQISFEHINQTRPSAANLLTLISFCDRQGIPDCLLKKLPGKLESDHEFENDVQTLRDFCLISSHRDRGIETHRLVQQATQAWLSQSKKLEDVQRQVITTICNVFPCGGYENWPRCRTLFAHAKSALENRPKDDAPTALLLAWANLSFLAGYYAAEIGNAVDAMPLTEQCMMTRTQLLEADDEQLLLSIRLAARANIIAHQEERARKLLQQVLYICSEKRGEYDTLAVDTSADLAWTYMQQKRWEEANRLQTEMLPQSVEKHGYTHHTTRTLLSGFANSCNMLRNKGYSQEIAKAEKMLLHVSQVYAQEQGQDHPNTLHTNIDLALMWKLQGRYSEAIYLMRQCVQSCERVYSSEHSYTQQTVNRLARWESELTENQTMMQLPLR
jgi:hypothetical protein